MLIQFSVKNYRSIKDEAELQLITDAGKELLATNTFKPDAKGVKGVSLMKSAVMYGANAAGKSTVIDALAKMRWLVRFSATKLQAGDPLDIDPFRFSTNSIKEPTEFHADFISDGIRFQYGFVANNQRVLEEWLFAYPNDRPQTWFIREYNEQTDQYTWEKDSYLVGPKSSWKEATRENALFLSTAVQLNSKQLLTIYQWFTETLRIVGSKGLSQKYTANQILEGRQSNEDILSFLKAGDLGIVDIKVEKDDAAQSISPKLNVLTGHQLEDGSLQYIDLKDESDGTQRMFSFAAPMVQSLNEGLVVFIDELNNSLHPTMVKFLVSLFNSEDENPNNAQLIFTTHETSILSQDVFRRDQIWFCEKNKAQSTSLYSLSDFKVRKGADNIERNYLSGKYGALPFIDKSNLGEING